MRMRTLCHDLANAIPGLTRVNRGKMSLYEIVERANQLGTEKILIIDRWQGGPGRIRLFKTDGDRIAKVSPTLYISGVIFRRELGATRKRTHSVFIDGTGGGGQEIKALKESLSNFFCIPVTSPNDASTQYQATMRVSMHSSNRLMISFYTMPSGVEIGLRITVSHVAWED